jgi:hypothetical protein
MDEQYRISLIEKAIALIKDIDDDRIADVVPILEAVSFDREFATYLGNLASYSLGDEEFADEEEGKEN